MWQKVWAKFGIAAADLDPFFSGPSFLAWNRMGNLQGYGGPLSQSYIDDQAGWAKPTQQMLTRHLHCVICKPWTSMSREEHPE